MLKEKDWSGGLREMIRFGVFREDRCSVMICLSQLEVAAGSLPVVPPKPT